MNSELGTSYKLAPAGAYKVKTPLRVRSGIISPQIDNGVKLQGGGHQYEIIDYLGNDWQKYLIPIDTKGVKLK